MTGMDPVTRIPESTPFDSRSPGPRRPLERPPGPAFRGRGAGFNPPNRFETIRRDPFFDGWEAPAGPEEAGADPPAAAVPTTVTVDATRTVIARNDSPDVGFDRSINPYRGCEHGCVYCYARPTHAWLGLSPGVDFETRLFAKPDAATLLRQELARPSYRCAPIAMGTNTDPYQPVERERRITREILKVLADCNHPVTIVTKSALIERDIDILAPMAEKGLTAAALSVTTLERTLARAMEPRAAAPARRLAAIRSLAEAGIPVRVMVAPVVPGITDHEMEAILEAARDAGASLASWILLRLPGEVKELFADWLDTHYPAKRNKVLNTIRSLREGRLNNAEWGERMVGKGAFGKALDIRFAMAVRRLGLKREGNPLRTDLFMKPARDGRQMSLF
ncbi:MAG: PA0069 family radical SAM protein [Rhodospirillaceae bacterium]|nr:PA0069 family radical SAM protein [Rhodospirillaceae bacterium]